MDFEEEYKQNRTQLNRIKKEGKIFLIICSVDLIFFLISMFFFISSGNLKFLVSLLVFLFAPVFGYLSIYKKNQVFALLSAVLAFCELLLTCFITRVSVYSFILFGAFIGCCIRNFMNVKMLHWLQQQDGFPYFEPRQKMYDMNRTQWDIKDPFTLEKERYEKRSTGHMDDI